MSITVCKFGGSSVSDAGMFVRVARIICSCPDRKYIVLSAPGKRSDKDEKITDLFYRAHEAVCRGDYSILAQIFARYACIRDALAPGFDLESEFAKIRTKLHISMDYAASRGEYLCAKLFAAYMHMPFVDAAELFFFDTDGCIDAQSTSDAIRRRLHPLGQAVIPGFYGVKPDGGIKTFSRGGSDVSGSLIAAALNADLYENWTDVDGLYTADPTLVPDTCRNALVSLSQMKEIAAAGAKLLHQDALSPLQGTHIDTLLKNTFSPGAQGTRISEDFIGEVRCVTGRRDLYMFGNTGITRNENSELLLHNYPVPGGIHVAAISIFGMEDEKLRRLEKLLNPIHIIHMRNHIQIIMPDCDYENTLRAAHKILME